MVAVIVGWMKCAEYNGEIENAEDEDDGDDVEAKEADDDVTGDGDETFRFIMLFVLSTTGTINPVWHFLFVIESDCASPSRSSSWRIW